MAGAWAPGLSQPGSPHCMRLPGRGCRSEAVQQGQTLSMDLGFSLRGSLFPYKGLRLWEDCPGVKKQKKMACSNHMKQTCQPRDILHAVMAIQKTEKLSQQKGARGDMRTDCHVGPRKVKPGLISIKYGHHWSRHTCHTK